MSFVKGLVSLCVVLLLTACTTNGTPEALLSVDTAQGAAANSQSTSNILYVTDRSPTETPTMALSYGTSRARFMSFGSATMHFDNAKSKDSGNPDVSVAKVTEIGRFPQSPYRIERVGTGVRRDPAAVAQHDQAARELQAAVAAGLARSPRKEVVVFVHGYANTFDDAMDSTAKICRTLKEQFLCIALTWPAGGTDGLLMGYNVDRESGEFAVADLKRALRIISETPGVERVNVMAHSRGTDVITSVLQQLGIEAYVSKSSLSNKFRIANVILFAPDIDADVASTKMFGVVSDPDLPFGAKPNRSGVMQQGFLHMTVYSSPNDKALGLSSRLFGSALRLGQLSILQLPKKKGARRPPEGDFGKLIDFIEFDGKAGFSGHSYFLSSPKVRQDIQALLLDRIEAGAPGRPLIEIKRPFWRIDETK